MDRISDNVKKYRDVGYTCAESALLGANDAWGLGLTPEDCRIMGGFAGGFGCGYICGAVSGGVAALSLRYLRGNGHRSPLLTMKTRTFVEAVEQLLGTKDCDELAKIYRNQEENCTPTVRVITSILDEIEKLELDIPEYTDYDLRFPPEGKPGFREFHEMMTPVIRDFVEKHRIEYLTKEKK